MRKVFLSVLIGMMLVICGCDNLKPTELNVQKDAQWEIWAQGTLTDIVKGINPSCGNSDPTSCSKHPLIDYYVFNDERKVCFRLLINPGLMSIGQTGTLYKHTQGGNSNKDYHSWFQWVRDVNIPILAKTSILAKKISIPTNKDNSLRITIDKEESEWNLSSDGKPKRYTPVLIKFKNDTISVGYINNLNDWKLSINQREENGGETISNQDIIFWKSVDIR